MNMDWDKEGSGDFIVYPEGTYKVTIDNFEQITASTGTKQIRWKTTIIEPKEYAGKPFTTHTPLTDKALWKIARLVKGCGIDLKSLPKMEVGTAAFMKVLESCKRRTTYWHLLKTVNNKGKDVNEVDDFRIDSEQQVETVESIDDTPAFLKEN